MACLAALRVIPSEGEGSSLGFVTRDQMANDDGKLSVPAGEYSSVSAWGGVPVLLSSRSVNRTGFSGDSISWEIMESWED